VVVEPSDSNAAPWGFPNGRSERKTTMNFLQILQTILSVAPSGIQLTQEVVALVQAIEAAFSAGQTPASHQEAVATALGAHLAKQ
jgi:hypothetical protein